MIPAQPDKAKTGAGSDGFTLLEVLVGLAVLAIMAALMSSFLSQLGSVSRLEANVRAQTRLDAAANHVGQQLKNMRPIRLLDAEPDQQFYIDGKTDSVRVTIVTRQGISALALRDMRIFFDPADGGLYQTISPRRLVGGAPDLSAATTTKITGNISALRFSYADGAAWDPAFSGDGELPDAVRVEVSAELNGRTITSAAIAAIN